MQMQSVRRFKLASAGVMTLVVAFFVFLWKGVSANAVMPDFAGHANLFTGVSGYVLLGFVIGLAGLLAILWREVRRLSRQQLDLAKYSLVANKADSAVMILNPEGQIEWVNDGFQKITGWAPDKVPGKTPVEVLLQGKSGDRGAQLIQDGLKHRKTVNGEVCCVHKMGNTTYWLSLSLTPIFNDQAKLVQFVGIGTNITARKRAEDALARMSRWYEMMLNAMREGICGVDLNGTITFLNPAVTRMTGWKAGELIGQPVSQLMHQLQVDAMPEAEENQFIGVAFKDGTVQMGDMDCFRRKDGTIFPVDYTSTQVREEEQLHGFVVVFRDISERKQAEASRARQARQYALRAEIGFCLATSENLRGFLDRTCQALLRHMDASLARVWLFNPEEEMLEMSVSAGLSTRTDGPEGRIPLGTFTVGKVAKSGEPALINDLQAAENEVDAEWIRQERLMSFVGFPLVVENRLVAVLAIYSHKRLPGDTLELLGGLSDAIGQAIVRKRAEEKVAEQAALLDKSRDAILVADLKNQCQYWNKSAESLYGWSPKEALGKRIDQLIYADPNGYFHAREAVLADGEWKEESSHVTREGQTVLVESHWTLVQDKSGRPQSILMVNTNVTEKKAMEEKFLRTQRMESIGTLAGGIAHDLNNILSPILMSVEVLRDRFDDPSSQRLLSMVESSAKRGAEMVKQVLTFSRGVHRQRVLLQTRHLVKEVGHMVEETFPKNIHLRLDMPENLWAIQGDATQLHQVLVNLVVNARDAMPEGGSLRMAAENQILETSPLPRCPDFKPGFYVVIRVQDTGTGIAAGKLGQIFEPFYTTKDDGKGTGLGLSTVRDILKTHGGFVDVRSQEGHGTEFTLYLPAHDTSKSEAEDTPVVRLPGGRGECILVVDDEASVLSMTREMLETYGYQVLTATDGTEAIAVYSEQKSRIQCVLTDMVMPHMDGPATIRTLKRMNPEVRIVASSGLMDANKVKDATGLQQITYLMKPYTAEKLLGTVRTVLDGEGESEGEQKAA